MLRVYIYHLLNDGDLVFIKQGAKPKNGDIAIDNIDGKLYAKKYLRNPAQKEARLTSLNEFYQDMSFSYAEFKRLNIVGVIRTKLAVGFK